MNIPLTAEIVKERYIDAYNAFVEYLRNSKTKSKNTPESDFEYSYSWSEQIQGESFADIMNGKSLARQKADQEKSMDVKIAERMQRSSVGLFIKAGRVSKFYPIAGYYPGENDRTGQPIPVEVFMEISHQEQEAHAEKLRIDSLTPEERQSNIDELLGSLRKNSGFSEVRLPGKPQ